MIRRALHIGLTCLTLSLASPLWAQDNAEETPQNSDYIWDICNETSYVLRVAHALVEKGITRVEGWRDVNPGACLPTPYNDPDTPRFLYAESLPLHRGGIREWKGTTKLCAKDEDFTSEATDNCALLNMDERGYLAVKPSESRTSLIEPSDFGSKAQMAGIQRLLRDNGYKISKIDGLTGRRTSRSLSGFRKEAGIDKNIKGEELMEVLRTSASRAIRSVGIDMCNDSTAKIWGAVASREYGKWTSRGWWEIAVGDCTHIYTKALSGSEAHIYALQENIDPENPKAARPDKRLSTNGPKAAQFCIAESRFSALGREYCAEGGYVNANFRPVSTEEDGVKITLTDDDFSEASTAGLRR